MQTQLESTIQVSTAPATMHDNIQQGHVASAAKSVTSTKGEAQNRTGKPGQTVRTTTSPGKQKPKQGMLQLACFCFRPRTKSTEDPYPQQSLRDRFTPRPDAAANHASTALPVNHVSNKAAGALSSKATADTGNIAADAISSKGEASGSVALKNKGGLPAGGLARGETAQSDWDLKAEQHQMDAAAAASLEDAEERMIGEGGMSDPTLQGAISLAPKHGLAPSHSLSEDGNDAANDTIGFGTQELTASAQQQSLAVPQAGTSLQHLHLVTPRLYICLRHEGKCRMLSQRMPVLLDWPVECGGTEFVHWLCMSASRSLRSCALNYIQAGNGNTLPTMLGQLG